MSLVSKNVEVHASGKNVKHYKDLGYEIPHKENGRIDRCKTFSVNVNDIPTGSTDVYVSIRGLHYEWLDEYKQKKERIS